MFRKSGSSLASTGASSSTKKETPLRKSDIRRLRDRFLEGGYGKNAKTDLDPKHLEAINDAFGCGSNNEMITRRKIRVDGENITIYTRCPSTCPPSETTWPYNRTNQPLVLEIEDSKNKPVLIPCLALLSIISPYLPNVVIASETSKYICRGADLMKGGVMSLPSGHKQGTIVSVSVIRNEQPFAVGILTGDTNRMEIGFGNKGMAVKILICYGDDLWKIQYPDKATLANLIRSEGPMDDGNYFNPGFLNGEKVYSLIKVDDEENNTEGVENDDQEECVDDENNILKPKENEDEAGVAGDSKEAQNPNLRNDSDEQESEEQTEEERHETLLLECFYKAIIFPPEPIKLPLPVSVFYAKHILSARPPDSYLDLKKTSYKKIGVFLSEQEKSGIITLQPSKDKKEKAAFLSGIVKSHPLFRQIKRELKGSVEIEKEKGSGKSKLAVVNLYCIPSHFVPLLRLNKEVVNAAQAKSPSRRGTGFLTSPECGEILTMYITNENLIDEYDPSQVILDGPLCDAIYKRPKKSNGSPGIDDGSFPTEVSRKELMDRWMEKMEKAHAIVRMPGNEILSMKRGEPSKINISVARGTGGANRYVTRVRGLEEYNINGVDFSKDVSKRFASSGAIDTNPKKSAALKKGCVEVVFGGHLLEELTALLTGNAKITSHGGAKKSPYCVPKGAIDYKLGKGVTKKKSK